MDSQWSHDDVFPVIARAIDTLHNRRQTPGVSETPGVSTSESDFVTHDDIVAFLLEDSEAMSHIDSARDAADDDRSRDWVAHNMVAWFSQRITVEDSEWSSCFERARIDGKWAYRPVESGS